MFKKQSLFWLIAVVFVLVSVASQPVLASFVAGDTALNFTLKDHFTNQDVSLYDYEGHIILLDFFAHWCGPCQVASSELEPYIQEYYNDLGGNPSSIPVKLISINIQANAESQTNAYIEYFGLKTVWEDPSGIAYGQYVKNGIPLFAIINGAAGTNKDQWEVLYCSAGYGSGMYNSFRTTINSVEFSMGSLQVTLGPLEALGIGGQWNVDGGDWQNSGATVDGLSPGNHTVNYKAINDAWKTIPSEQVTIISGETTTLDRTYEENTEGNLQVTLGPLGALIDGLQWSVDGGPWQLGGAMVKNLSAGVHTVNYKAIDQGWRTIPSEEVTITAAETTKLDRTCWKIADLNEDGWMNLIDFAMLAGKWQLAGPRKEDLDGDGSVGNGDLYYLADHWLEPKMVPGLADAYVRGGNSASTNFGSATGLVVRNTASLDSTREIYLRFNYEDRDGYVVENATLTLTPTAVYADRTLRIRLVDDSQDSWFEGGINWNSKPTSDGLEVTFSTNDLTLNQPYSIDVTSLLNQEITANGIATFHIDGATENITGINTFASREHETADWHPALEVESVIAGDINDDGSVNMLDLYLLSSQWLGTGSADIAPGSGDGIVDIIDLLEVTGNWLHKI